LLTLLEIFGLGDTLQKPVLILLLPQIVPQESLCAQVAVPAREWETGAQFSLRRALSILCLPAEKHSLTIWLPIKQNARKCFCCFHLKFIYLPCSTQRTKRKIMSKTEHKTPGWKFRCLLEKEWHWEQTSKPV